MRQRGGDVGVEQRMPGPRVRLELGVKLHADEPGVNALRKLDHLGELFLLRHGGDHQTG